MCYLQSSGQLHFDSNSVSQTLFPHGAQTVVSALCAREGRHDSSLLLSASVLEVILFSPCCSHSFCCFSSTQILFLQ